MPLRVQEHVPKFPGYGVVYPEGTDKGLKVKKTFTDGGEKIRHQDGSVTYGIPKPTVHELVGGVFAYASGQPVTKREDLERLPEGMKERALKWFDSKNLVIPAVAVVDKPPEGVQPERPEPAWVVSSSSTMIDASGKPIVGVVEPAKVPISDDPIIKALREVSDVVSGLSAILTKQGEDIEMMKKGVKLPGKRGRRGSKKGHPNPGKGIPLGKRGDEALSKMGLGETP
jgi:hypothetical protein